MSHACKKQYTKDCLLPIVCFPLKQQTFYSPTSSDPLELAISVVAADLGDDWPALYFRLHFQPFRSVDERRRDVIGRGINTD